MQIYPVIVGESELSIEQDRFEIRNDGFVITKTKPFSNDSGNITEKWSENK